MERPHLEGGKNKTIIYTMKDKKKNLSLPSPPKERRKQEKIQQQKTTMKQTQIQIQNHIAFSRRRGGARNKTRGIRYHLKPPCIVRRTSSVKKNPDLPLFPNTHTLVCVCVYLHSRMGFLFLYRIIYVAYTTSTTSVDGF